MSRTRWLSVQYMRGFAALLVLYAHIVVVGTTDPVTPRLYLPMVPHTPVSGTQILAAEAFLRPEYFIERFRIVSGDLGVAIFFLISGFVIQGSLQTLSPGLFIGRRIFRIYPLTIFVVFITAIVLAVYCRLYGVQEPFTIHSTILSAFLLNGFFPSLYVLPVLWSLMVEVSFYVLMACIFLLSKKCGYLEMITAGTSCLLLTYLGTDPPAALLPVALQVHNVGYMAVYMIYMLIGSAIFRGVTTPNEILKSTGTVIVLLSTFLLGREVFQQHSPNYVHITVITSVGTVFAFAAGLAAERVLRWWPILAFFGDISFPLYLVHVPLGWAMIYELSRRHVPLWLSMSITVVTCILLAWLLHVTVEKPSYILGQRWLDKMLGRQPTKAEPVRASS
jgi:peptidoglycan/LPS O-acetylase OafA/YrhL